MKFKQPCLGFEFRSTFPTRIVVPLLLTLPVYKSNKCRHSTKVLRDKLSDGFMGVIWAIYSINGKAAVADGQASLVGKK